MRFFSYRICLDSNDLPKKDELDNVERLALSSGFKHAIASFLAVLKLLQGQDYLIAACSLLLTIVLIIFAAYRREKQPPEERFYVHFTSLKNYRKEPGISYSKTDRISTGILIFTIVLAVSMLYFVITAQR